MPRPVPAPPSPLTFVHGHSRTGSGWLPQRFVQDGCPAAHRYPFEANSRFASGKASASQPASLIDSVRPALTGPWSSSPLNGGLVTRWYSSKLGGQHQWTPTDPATARSMPQTAAGLSGTEEAQAALAPAVAETEQRPALTDAEKAARIALLQQALAPAAAALRPGRCCICSRRPAPMPNSNWRAPWPPLRSGRHAIGAIAPGGR